MLKRYWNFSSAAVLLFAANGLSHTVIATPAHYELDLTQSIVKWTGSKPTGKHNGTVNFKQGFVEFDGAQIKKAEFTVDMTSIKDVDLTDESYRTKLETHLKSEDFFDVAKHPTATFVLKNAKPGAAGKTEVTGSLTIKGHAEDVSFPVEIKTDEKTSSATGLLKIDRTKWKIMYKSPSLLDLKGQAKELADKIIYDEMELEINLVAHAKAKAPTKSEKAEKHSKKKK